MTSDSKSIFLETQKFNQWWIYVILGLATIPFITFFAYQEATGKLIGNHPMNNDEYIFTIVIICLVNILFLFMRLQTKIDTDGIHVRFFPFKFNYGHYKWTEIEKVSLRSYDPISAYGGWGIRYSFSNGKALTTSGNWGIQIEAKNGKKTLIGTQKSREAEIAIRQFKKT
jgi:hypothetical protein